MDVKAICALDYTEMAAAIVGQYLTDYSQEFLQEAAKATYGAAFGGKAGYLAPVSDEVYSLELWHGPTCAFKDYALQLMPRLLVEAKKNLGRTEKTLILVATSGDTARQLWTATTISPVWRRGVLPHGRHQRDPAPADGHPGGCQCGSLRRARQL